MEEEKERIIQHETFKLGQGYASGEPSSTYQSEKRSRKQLGDNPLPQSGGGYAKAGEVQPREDLQTPPKKKGPKRSASKASKRAALAFFLALLFSFPLNAPAQTNSFFDCVITHQFYRGDFVYLVRDGWNRWYGPFRFHFDAMWAAEELRFRGDCDQIDDRSW